MGKERKTRTVAISLALKYGAPDACYTLDGEFLRKCQQRNPHRTNRNAISDDAQKIECPHCKAEFFHDGSLAGMTVPCPTCGDSIKMPGTEPPTRSIEDRTLDLACDIYGQHPVQAEGRVRGHPFYFRAKWDFWTFTVRTNSDNEDVPASISPTEEQNGLFDDGDHQGFFLSDAFGSDTAASCMDLDTAETIIRKSAQQFIEAITSS